MKLRCLVIALALLAAFASDSWGQSKRPPGSDASSKQNTQSAAPDQRGTENMPLSVKILPGEKTGAETTKEKYEAEEKPTGLNVGRPTPCGSRSSYWMLSSWHAVDHN